MTVLAIDEAVLKTVDHAAGLFGAQPELWPGFREAVTSWLADGGTDDETERAGESFETFSQALLGAYFSLAVMAMLVALPVRAISDPWGWAGAVILATVAGICTAMAIAHTTARTIVDRHDGTTRLRFGFAGPLNVVAALVCTVGFIVALA